MDSDASAASASTADANASALDSTRTDQEHVDAAPASADDDAGAEHHDDIVAREVDFNSIDSLKGALAETEAALAASHEEVEALKDQVLRAAAEVENVRRRADRSVENAHKFALEEFVADLLPAIDSFERAVAAAHEIGADDTSVGATVEGIELSLKVLMDVLKRRGIETLNPEGEPFNPQFHEALSMVPNPDAEPGSILHVVEKGYTLHDRLVRAAKVVVAKAPDGAADAP